MKLFQQVEKIFRALAIHPTQHGKNTPFNLRNILIAAVMGLAGVLTTAYCLFQAKTVREYGDSFYAAVTAFLTMMYFLTLLWKMEKVLQLIAKYEAFIQKRDHNAVSKKMYEETNQMIEKVSKVAYFFIMRMTVPGVVMPSCLITTYNYFVDDLKEESFFLPFPVMLPFNWKTPGGYLFALILQSIAAFCVCLFLLSVLCFFIGSSWLLMGFVEDIANDFSLLSDAQTSQNEDPAKLKVHFCDIIQLYSSAKQFTNEVSEIYEFILTGVFLWSLVTICSSLLVLQAEIKVWIWIDMVSTSYQVFWSFASIFFFCEFGEQVTSRFEKFNDELDQCCWYSFPIDLQRMIPTIMANTQTQTFIRGYGNTLCTRYSFNKTVKGGFSYFMMLHQVNA